MRYGIYKSGLLLGEAFWRDDLGWEIRPEVFFTDDVASTVLPSPLDFDITGTLEKIRTFNAAPFILKNGTVNIQGTSYQYVAKEAMLYEQTAGLPVDLILHNDRLIGCAVARREYCAVICEHGFENATPLVHWQNTPYRDGLIRKTSCMIPMRDGVLLATDVYRLADGDATPRPAILVRTPYGKQRLAVEEWRFVKLGYALVVQDVRGRFESEGNWIPLHAEINDGHDTLAYLSAQAWCNGKVGMIGASYGAYTQMCAAASGHPALKAAVSLVTAGGPFTDIPRRGGSLLSGFMAWSSAVAGKEINIERMQRDDWADVLRHKPIEDIPGMLVDGGIPFFDAWLQHETYNDFWQKDDWTLHNDKIKVPTLFVSGFFDDNVYGTTSGYTLAREKAFPHKLIMGAWGHNFNTRRHLNGFHMGEQTLRYDLDYQFIHWLNHWLVTAASQAPEPEVEFYDFRAQTWRTTAALPLREAQETTFFLSPNQRLALSKPSDGHVAYRYDPAAPTPSLINPSENEMNMIGDFSAVDARDDVVFFESDAFLKPLLLTGTSTVTLFVSSDCPDTDFLARLSIVTADGTALKIAENIRRAKFHAGFNQEVFLIPDHIVSLTIPLQLVGVTIDRGEKLRLSISSAAENLFFTNGNSGETLPLESTPIVAHNNIHFGTQHPSAIQVSLGGQAAACHF